MPTDESVKPSNSSTGEGEKRKQFDREIKDMVTAITRRFSDIEKTGGGSTQQHEDEDDNGVRVITLAGTNNGATLRSELDDKPTPQGVSLGDPDALSTYVNSNFQAINNSIMMGGSYSTNDPGVHLDISDLVENKGHKPGKHGKKGKKKEHETDHDTEHTD